MLSLASENPDFLAAAKAFAENKKYNFDVKVGLYTIVIRDQIQLARRLISLFGLKWPIDVLYSDKQIIIVDRDVYLNRKFLSIFAPIQPGARKGELGVCLTVGHGEKA